jgi:DNA-binding beta-propeller fold protein YncE
MNLVELKNKNILVGSLDDFLLALYDSEFKLIRKITEINHVYMYPHGLACDPDGNVYFTNGHDRSLYKLDSELNFIKLI